MPDNDCIDCTKPLEQGCSDGYIMDASPHNGCTKITCTKPGNILIYNSIENNELS